MAMNDANAQADTDAGQTADSSADENDTPPGEPESHDDQPDRTEARLRKRAQRAEQERDQARALLDRQRQVLVDAACSAAGLTERHVRAAEITPAVVLDDEGLIDLEALSTVVTDAVDEFGIRKARRPAPVPGQGGSGAPPHRASWAGALKG